jgi:hypothetical protein
VRIKNWKKFQHFSNRRPPWIKLYRDILDDLQFHELTGDAAKTLVMLWLIASEGDEGQLPDLKTLTFRLRTTEKKLKETVSTLSHWIEHDDIKAISERYQNDPSETEREREIEKEGEKSVATNGVARHVAPHVDFVEGFKKTYEAMTGQNFKANGKEYSLAAGLVRQFGVPACVDKVQILGDLCKNKSAWFTKEGWSAFTIPKLSEKWNEILPREPEKTKDDELKEELAKWRK